jgi:two-component sensor histidine kinase/DNA-binding response OmpR family regulator
MSSDDKVNVLLVDDQPAKLLAYEVILRELNENLVKASSAREALEFLLKNDVAVVLIDVCMPELDGFQLAAMIRDHPRFQKTALIFVSAIHLTDVDHLRGYEMGAVDYVPVPVIPEVLRAKVRVFADLYRKTRQLETLNRELERRVAERTAEVEASAARLRESEQRRSVALAAGQMGSWDWDVENGQCMWDAGQYRIFAVDPENFELTYRNIRPLIHPEDLQRIEGLVAEGIADKTTFQTEARILRPNGELRWCICAAAMTTNAEGRVVRVSGVTVDITDRKEAEERQTLLAREVDHRARNALAVVQSIVRLTRAKTTQLYASTVEGRIRALAQAHNLISQSRWQGADLGTLVEEELNPYRSSDGDKIVAQGPAVSLRPVMAQTLALALHELATNAAKYGALSTASGRVRLQWDLQPDSLVLNWSETGGPATDVPSTEGFGTQIINASIRSQLGGQVTFDWLANGLTCTLTVPYRGAGEPAATPACHSVKENGGTAPSLPATTGGKRVLLVEDEVIIGLMMRDLLTDAGYAVSGPHGSIAPAISAAEATRFDGAVLDINLGAELIYPVADILANQGVPFIFVTGYDEHSVDSRFAEVPILQKPLDRRMLETIFITRLHDSGTTISPTREPARGGLTVAQT